MNWHEVQQSWQLYFLERRQLVTGVLCGAAAALIAIFATVPLWGKFTDTRRQLVSLESQFERVSARSQLLESLSSEDELDFQRVESALPLQKQPFTALLLLNQVASASGVSIVQYDLNPGIVSTGSATGTAQAAGKEVFTLGLTILGDMAQTQRAFALLETSLPLIEIAQFSMSPQKQVGSNSASLLQTEMSLQMYSLPLESKQVDIKKGAQALTAQQARTLDKLQEFTLPVSLEESIGPGVKFNNQNYLGSE